MKYIEKAREWVVKNNLKVGDRVKVLKKANEWRYWCDSKDELVGYTFEVIEIDSYFDIKIKSDSRKTWLPYYILEKVEADVTISNIDKLYEKTKNKLQEADKRLQVAKDSYNEIKSEKQDLERQYIQIKEVKEMVDNAKA